MRWIVLALVLVAGSAWSNDPVKPQTMGGDQKTKAEQRGTEKAPIFVKGDVTTQKTKEEADGDAEDRKQKSAVDKSLVKYTGLNALFTLFLFMVALAQVGLFVWQLRLMREAVADAKDVASAAKSQSESLIRAERAYVKMSHAQPGINFQDGGGAFVVVIGVKNFGRTPAYVTDALIKHLILPITEPLPNFPDYKRTERDRTPVKGFLVTNDEIFLRLLFPFGQEHILPISTNSERLYLYGFVDYIDQFGQRHRGGYARVYNNDSPANNLDVVSQDRYNYDRPRKKGEGNDWDEEATA